MKKMTLLFLTAIFLCNAGCAKKVTKIWEAAGGSRADATVEVGFIYNPENEIPNHSEQQALQEAIKRCKAWGYGDAESFGLVKSRCQATRPLPFGGVICTSMLVTRQFQCLGRGDMATLLEMHTDKEKTIIP